MEASWMRSNLKKKIKSILTSMENRKNEASKQLVHTYKSNFASEQLSIISSREMLKTYLCQSPKKRSKKWSLPYDIA